MNLNTTRNRYIVPPTAEEAQSFEQGLFGDQASESTGSRHPGSQSESAAPPVRSKKPAVPPQSADLPR